MEKIKDLDNYNKSMAKSLSDKTFFLNYIDVDAIDRIVDFGCADGSLLEVMPKQWVKVGVDNNEDMRAECKLKSIKTFTALDEVEPREHSLLNMSSVLHEVYSYLSGSEIKNFWNNVFSGDYDYIAIRDMMVSENILRDPDPIYGDIFFTKGKYNNEYANSFFEVWGDPYHEDQAQIDLIHYLLKYRYTDNWPREVNENYLPISVEQLKALIPDNYEIICEEEYILPFLKEQVKKDFNYTIRDNTHIKLLLKRR